MTSVITYVEATHETHKPEKSVQYSLQPSQGPPLCLLIFFINQFVLCNDFTQFSLFVFTFSFELFCLFYFLPPSSRCVVSLSQLVKCCLSIVTSGGLKLFCGVLLCISVLKSCVWAVELSSVVLVMWHWAPVYIVVNLC
jgi:hypothetical protein